MKIAAKIADVVDRFDFEKGFYLHLRETDLAKVELTFVSTHW
jgi:hypothetical protein